MTSFHTLLVPSVEEVDRRLLWGIFTLPAHRHVSAHGETHARTHTYTHTIHTHLQWPASLRVERGAGRIGAVETGGKRHGL